MKKAILKALSLVICLTLLVAIGIVPVSAATATGYCAVGEVDAAASKAAILTGDGVVSVVSYTGTAPTAGTVMSFSATEGVYTFSAVVSPYAIGAGYDTWRLRDNGDNADAYDGGSMMISLDETCVGFIKFSDTSWRAYQGSKFLCVADGVGDYPATCWPNGLQAIWSADTGTMVLVNLDVNNNNYTKTGNGPEPTKLFDPTGVGFTTGDKDVVIPDEPSAALPVIEVPFADATGKILGKSFEPIDISDYMANGYIHISINIVDATDLGPGGGIELTSSARSDEEEISYPPETAGLFVNGDQTTSIKLSDFTPSAGTFDPTAFDFFRIFSKAGAGTDMTISRITITNSATPPAAILPVIEFASDLDAGPVSSAKLDTPIDISEYMANGYLHIWLDAEAGDLGASQIELTSSGGCDTDEIHADGSLFITTGQANVIAVKLSDMNNDGSAITFDPTALNYFRIYTGAGAGPAVTISRVAFSNTPEAPAAPEPVETEAPATDAPATDAPATNPPAPVTSDVSIAIGSVVLAAAAAAIVIISKKRK